VTALPRSKSATEAAVKAGCSEKTARFIASENLTRPNIRRAIAEVLDKVGLTDEKLTEYLKTNIEAGTGRKATASDSLRGIEMAFKLKDRFPSEKRVVRRIDYRVTLKGKTVEELEEELERLRLRKNRILQLSPGP